VNRRTVLGWLGVVAACLTTGCASTTIHKDPGPHDKGLRFYRPKPYLLLTPLDHSKWGEVGPDEMVELKLEWLPDFSEEYSVRARTGIGVNKTKITLKDGWNLTQLDVDTDAKFKDNLDAITNLVKAAAPSGLIAPPTKKPSTTSGERTDDDMIQDPNRPYRATVRATNVPIGYYESVIGRGPDGRKQLYGWRYVGFAPFVGCPLAPSGAECAPCEPNQLFGLVFERGVMTFKPLVVLPGGADSGQTKRPVAMPPEPPAPPKQTNQQTTPADPVEVVKGEAAAFVKSQGVSGFDASRIPKPTPDPTDPKRLVFTVQVTPSELVTAGKTRDVLEKALNDNRSKLSVPEPEKTVVFVVVEK
jgi:hypothetical protein